MPYASQLGVTHEVLSSFELPDALHDELVTALAANERALSSFIDCKWHTAAIMLRSEYPYAAFLLDLHAPYLADE